MIRIAIDSGSVKVGVVIADGDTLPAQALHVETIEVGELVELAKPKEQPGGKIQTHRRSVTSEHVEAIADKLRDLALKHGVTRAIFEHVERVYMNPASPAAHSSIATHMSRTAWIEGQVSGTLRAAGIKVDTIQRATWRARVLPKRVGRGGENSAEHLPGVVRASFSNWPGGDEHAEDAAGVLVSDIMGPQKVGRKPKGEKRATKKCGCYKNTEHFDTCPKRTKVRLTWETIKELLDPAQLEIPGS